jgi:amino acid adenylation domain-containing protein
MPANRHVVDVLRRRAEQAGDKTAYVFLPRGEGPPRVLTYGALDARARAIAAALREHSPAQERVLMVYPSGLEFIEAFWGCLYARLVAVPSHLPGPGPRSSARLAGIVHDCRPRLVLSIAREASGLATALGRDVTLVTTDEIESGHGPGSRDEVRPEDVALLQYSSGSTGAPKGVIVSHANVLANQAMIQRGFGHTSASGFAGWLPFFHDMGLFGNVIQPVFIGAFGVLMSPLSFLQKPIRWLRAITHYGCHTAGAPNFAYEYCVRRIDDEEKEGLDLRSWQRAFNGAEKPRPETMRRFAEAFAPWGFREQAFYPCYGLAEAVLFATGRDTRTDSMPKVLTTSPVSGGAVLSHASSGRPWLGSAVCVVDARTGRTCRDGEEGEIWICGRHVAAGYWGRPELSEQTFGARLRGGRRRWLRTGDLGFLSEGELFVTGRLKDLVILRGENHHPEDIEAVVEAAHASLATGQCAAFALDGGEQGSELLAIALEVERSSTPDECRALAEGVSATVSRELGIAVAEVVVVRRGQIPKTSSGKVQRLRCRRLHAAGEFAGAQVFRFGGDGGSPVPTPIDGTSTRTVLERLAGYLAASLPTGASLSIERGLHEHGLDSVRVVELKHWVERELAVEVSVAELFEAGSVRQLAQSLASRVATARVAEPSDAEPPGPPRALSYGQRALLLEHARAPANPGANIALALRIEGNVDVTRLSAIVKALGERHTQLARAFTLDPRQAAPARPPRLEIVAATGWQPERVARELSARAAAPFDPSQAAVRWVALVVGPSEVVLLLACHHVAIDFLSLEVLVDEFLEALAGTDSTRPMPDVATYERFVQWEERWLRSARGAAGLSFWKRALADASPPPRLAFTAAEARDQGRVADLARFHLDAGATDVLAALAARQRVSLPALLFAAYVVLLSKLGRSAQVLAGFSVDGRPEREYAGTVGYFANVLPLNVPLGEARTFREVLSATARRLHAALDHRHYPYALLHERAGEGLPLVRHVFTFAPQRPGPARGLLLQDEQLRVRAGACVVSGCAFERSMAPFDLTLLLAERDGGLAGAFVVGSSPVGHAAAAELARAYEALLAQLEAVLDKPLGHLALATPVARPEPAETACPDSVLELFEAQVRARRAAIAVRHGDEALTYGALDARAEHVATALRRLGIGPESIVAVYCPRGLALVVAILGVVKSGAAYLPVDAAHPVDRLVTLVRNAGATAVLTVAGCREGCVTTGVPTVCVDALALEAAPRASRPALDPASLAYVIYTSGSTGVPKGVAVTHANLTRLLAAARTRFTLDAHDVWSLFHSVAFDFSVWELWGAWTTGATLVVLDAGDARDPERLVERLSEAQVTVLSATPSAFANLRPALRGRVTALALRYVVFGGEALPADLLSVWAGTPERLGRPINMYGITETTVHTTWRELCEDDAANGELAPLGDGLPGIDVHVVDAALQRLPRWFLGELAVGGSGVARGYLGQPALTAARFVPDPFGGPVGGRLYLSGDLGYRGIELHYAGRADAQVKVRGHRVELGEVAAHVRACPGVSAAAAIWSAGDGGSGMLTAYVVGVTDLTAAGLRADLLARVPEHLVPGRFLRVDRLPTNENGKLDQTALAAAGQPLPSGARHVEPRTAAERTLAHIWSEVLGVANVGIDDNYFVLGGDSIRSIQIVARAREAGLPVSLASLLAGQTIRNLAQGSDEAGAPPAALPTPAPFALLDAADRARLPEGLEDAYPAPRLLQGLVFHSSFSEDYQVYVTVLQIEARWNPQALRRAAEAVVARHPFLRSSIDASGYQECLQLVHARVDVPFEVHDITGLDEPAQQRVLHDVVAAQGAERFEWTRAPLVRFVVHRLGDTRLQITLADPYLDGWCVALLLRELLRNYATLLAGHELASPPAPRIGQPHQVALERAAVADADTRAFWLQTLSDAPDTLLSSAHQPSRGARLLHDRHTLRLPGRLLQGLEDCAAACRLPLRALLLGAHAVLLSRLVGCPDVVCGVIHNGRPEEPDGALAIGSFLNTVPFRMDVEAGETWAACLGRAFARERALLVHRRFPFAELKRLLGREPRFDVIFNYTHFHALSDLQVEGVQIRALYASEQTFFPLTVHFNRSTLRAELELLLDYDARKVGAAQVAALASAYVGLLEMLATQATLGREVGESFACIDAGLFPQATPKPLPDECLPVGAASVVEWIDRLAARQPDAIALVEQGHCISYRQLVLRAGRLAHLLVNRHGIGPEDRVGLHATHSSAAVIGILAVLKAGGAYVPFDAECPAERMRFMVEDCALKCVLVEEHLAPRLAAHALPAVFIDRFLREQSASGRSASAPPPHAQQLAYVMFTSGSTGRPKGVGIAHGALVNLARCALHEYAVTAADRILQFCTLEFDISVEEMFMALCAGACLVLRPVDLLASYAAFHDYCARERLTCLNVPTALWNDWVHDLSATRRPFDLPLRSVIIAGEAMRADLAERWAAAVPPRVELVNTYGPTETTVKATKLVVERGNERAGEPASPIGRAFGNAVVAVSSPRQHAVPPGVYGELFIGGLCVARGYQNRPALTAERFVPDPAGPFPGARRYRTGDVVFQDAQGSVFFVGRLDRQVKVSGFRVEPEEVEVVLGAAPGVREAAVIAELAEGRPVVLKAFVRMDDPDAARDGRRCERGLRAWLEARLPRYMMPAVFQVLSELPTTLSGKIDRQALARLAPPTTETEFQGAPSGVLEVVLRTYATCLAHGADCGPDANFFELGGDSLVAMRVAARLRDAFPNAASVRDLFEHPRAADLARVVAGRLASGGASDVGQTPSSSDVVLSFAQERLWVSEQLGLDAPAYNIPAAITLSGRLNVPSFEAALAVLQQRHAVLRTRIATTEGVPVPHVNAAPLTRLQHVELRGLPREARRRMLGDLSGDLVTRRFDLEHDAPLRVALFALDDREHELVVALHHIVADGWSVGILVRELLALYAAHAAGTPATLPELPIQYADFARRERESLGASERQRLGAYWREALAGAPDVLALPCDHPRPVRNAFRGRRIDFELDEALAGALARLARSESMTYFMVLLAAYKVLLHRRSGQTDIVIGTPVSSRDWADTEALIGLFVNQLVVRTDLAGQPTFRDLLRRVRSAVLAAYDHRGLPFEELVALLRPRRHAAAAPIVQSVFAFRERPWQDFRLEGLELAFPELHNGAAKYDLEVQVVDAGAGGLRGYFEYNVALFEPDTIQRLIVEYEQIVCELCAEPDRPIASPRGELAAAPSVSFDRVG